MKLVMSVLRSGEAPEGCPKSRRSDEHVAVIAGCERGDPVEMARRERSVVGGVVGLHTTDHTEFIGLEEEPI
jgi:hypothetical protein